MTSCGFEEWDCQLRESQINCVQQALQILEKEKPVIITSLPGSGKTAIGSSIAHEWNPDFVLVISVVSGINKWKRVLKALFDQKDVEFDIVSYEMLRRGNTNYISVIEDYLSITNTWANIIKTKKVLVIVDEFHRLQKSSLQTQAVNLITRSILPKETKNRLVMLSYTPCDNEADLINIIYSIGLIDENRIDFFAKCDAVKLIKEIVPLDQQTKFLDIASRLVVGKDRKSKATKIKLIQMIYSKYIVPQLTIHSIPDYAKNVDLKPEYANIMSEVSESMAKEIEAVLGSVIKIMNGGRVIKIIKGSKDTISVIAEKIEHIKIPVYTKLTENFLTENPTGKVVLMVLHINTIEILSQNLSKYNPVIYQGKMKIAQREEAITKFQDKNLDHRVFIGSLRASCESIDLHDTSENGNFPRLILIPPCYFTKSVVQSTHRVFRDGVTSKPIINIVYTTFQGRSLEKRYFDSVETKTKTISTCHSKGQKSLLPCDYPIISTSL
jgi:hypothetical protein